MTARSGTAEWRGNVQGGLGTVTVGDGVFEGAYSYDSPVATPPRSAPRSSATRALPPGSDTTMPPTAPNAKPPRGSLDLI
jgi:hypothetical protein